eukprot:CAMPEP_0170273218 /NCGR_PEP_ID=MMETSP0116_2-20130129/36571_1 /TAXON_ID=400756 /ORGANISM="Durinskia baltica, Strain CSIRO CS-38" /LENGTH=59 /DNA_ID=CAMNT_0010524445 /DNA_START=109 /DNA_END=288 /DNA_ORIENTATION=-
MSPLPPQRINDLSSLNAPSPGTEASTSRCGAGCPHCTTSKKAATPMPTWSSSASSILAA